MTLQTSKSADINTTKIAVLSLVSMVFIGRFYKLTQRPRCPHYTLLGVVTARGVSSHLRAIPVPVPLAAYHEVMSNRAKGWLLTILIALGLWGLAVSLVFQGDIFVGSARQLGGHLLQMIG
jgi:hypothetical protein